MFLLIPVLLIAIVSVVNLFPESATCNPPLLNCAVPDVILELPIVKFPELSIFAFEVPAILKSIVAPSSVVAPVLVCLIDSS